MKSRELSSLRILLLVLLIVFVAESVVMLVLAALPRGFSWLGASVLDATLLAIVSSPFLYWFVIKPFRTTAATESTKFSNLLEAAPEGIIGVAEDGRINFVNAQAESLFGYSREQLLGQPVESLIPPRFVEGHDKKRETYLRAPRTRPMGAGGELYGRRKDGTEFPAEVSLSHVETPEGSLVMSIVRDITVQKQTRHELLQANERLKEGLKDLGHRTQEMAGLTEMGELLQACLTAKEAYDVIGQVATRLFPAESGAVFLINSSRTTVEAAATWGNHPGNTGVFSSDACWALRRGRTHEGKPNCLANCSHVAPTEDRSYLCVPMLAQGEALGILHLLADAGDSDGHAVSRLETKRQFAMAVADCIGLALANLRLRETLRNQSIRDPLTNLFNVRFVQEWLEREIRRAVRNKRTLSIITFDIDHFKRFNDTFGHAGGDLLLRELAALLVTQIRGGDIACRIGGEEFAILLPEAPLDVAVQRAEKIRKAVQGLAVQYRGQPLGKITISLGVAAFPEHGDSGEQLFRVADQAVYRAKAEGRDRVIVAASGHVPSETSRADS